jgi:hypothetical protein
VCLWRERKFVDRPRAKRGFGESYNDVIPRLAAGDQPIGEYAHAPG